VFIHILVTHITAVVMAWNRRTSVDNVPWGSKNMSDFEDSGIFRELQIPDTDYSIRLVYYPVVSHS
jgi:hypothetical protein